MIARVTTVAFQGIDTLSVDVQVQMASGLPSFTIVGLPDKAVSEARERVRAAMGSIGVALPPKRITINLSPADTLKEGSHFDLPIALGLLSAMSIIPPDALEDFVALGELALDGAVTRVAGILPAAIHAAALERGLICPHAQGGEAAWAGDIAILNPDSLLGLINHFKGACVLSPPTPRLQRDRPPGPDMADVKGQESAKRALEVAAAGGHNLLMIGPPGSGKSMLAARLPGILPDLTPAEALDVSMIHSVYGALPDDGLIQRRPFRDPHHSASMPALVGGGRRARPGEISLAHNGVLFLDEFAEFSRTALDALRQPLETGKVNVARANAHVSYPARIQLVAAMNPCRCGHLDDAALACSRAPKCAEDYQARISGPLLDRIDLTVEVPALDAIDLARPGAARRSIDIRAHVIRARARQRQRYEKEISAENTPLTNAGIDAATLEKTMALAGDAQTLLSQATAKFHLSARGYHRVLRVARTLADLDEAPETGREHIAEALGYRRIRHGGALATA
ncbi:YifB family Mg chelatase-like AAA ATPase [Varunaivibrio sulfuroxidans]|uniref:Magnesium chelatase family protein n=1 Tax=Varunaivibrio sulfuroxidans TaxID=1773489 RepID=A0A4R3JHQ8_9PROT|nr:YifB family Mg chelatase-like AAA ATPase [Varunaivibrio sulfuroxidans]TCS64893.1 magnesium chelatase family protein [Varunaivibrio sulfuroxidans]WES29812.1 YifB family Mg chelatase-like AAA ATPase [Varunaivibrio sulfuroxidans]